MHPNDNPDGPDLDALIDYFVGLRMDRPRLADYLSLAGTAGPKFFPDAMPPGPTGQAEGAIYRALALWVADHLPLPEQRYAARRVARPGRNEPCLCGSGGKYKHCCAQLDGLTQMPPINFLPYVLDRLPTKRFADLPGSLVDTVAVADVAQQYIDGGRADLACKLLEPWFAGDGPLPGRLEILFDELANAYLENGNPRKKERLVEQAIARGDTQMRSAGYQRLATMHSDAGRHAEAAAAFGEAQRLTPDNPSLAHLEVLILLGRGAEQQAKARARFWLARFSRDGRDADEGLLEFLRATAEKGGAGMAELARGRLPELDRLRSLLEHAPPVASHYGFTALEADSVALEADMPLAAVEAGWREVFPQEKPFLTQTQSENTGAWDNAAPWLELLESKPLAWHSFDILDDLVLACDALDIPGGAAFILLPLLDRALALLDAVLPEALGARRTLPWMALENRPALRLLAHRAFLLDFEGREQDARSTMARIVALNPTDNHGLREPLSRLHLATGDPKAALTLLEHYPDDALVATPMNRALALWQVGREAEARRELNKVDAVNEHVVAMMLNPKARKPKMSPHGISYGGPDAAWLYREDHRELWEKSGALAWLKTARVAAPGD